ncbi:MAG: DUF3387 domain-containing protein [Firmicutes bacterium]|nr:DUF3387 domain-containing protein [Bacillota bacterium]
MRPLGLHGLPGPAGGAEANPGGGFGIHGPPRELTAAVRNSVSIDWSSRENVRAGLRVTVKRLLRRYGYPPEKRDQAADAVLEQAEAMTDGEK